MRHLSEETLCGRGRIQNKKITNLTSGVKFPVEHPAINDKGRATYVEIPAPVITTILFGIPSLINFATAPTVLSDNVCGGVSGSISSWEFS